MHVPPELRDADRLRVLRALLAAGCGAALPLVAAGARVGARAPADRARRCVPRDPGGLIGVLTAPLIHGSFEHLLANSLAVFALLALALYGYPRATARALPLIWLGSGLAVWALARDAAHLGASGLTHGLMLFLFALGLLRRDRLAMAVALIAFLLFGGMLMTVFPREPGVSWEYHLAGALFGLLAAVLTRRLDPPPPEPLYSWDLEPEDEAEGADELEPPRPAEVPALWRRPEPERGVIVPFPRPRRAAATAAADLGP
ncbi:MAG: rhomboid family intramembrane serine protease [Xanthomonadales bacterium]|nr:rhomboid family intramembrane serine protease [Xanthomonadales bacterium]